jgi:hypothetical protein
MRTNAGRDHQARVMADNQSDGTGDYAPANWIGLTANNGTPAAGDTTLTGEISTGTLVRAEAIYAHTNGTAFYTLTKSFTSDQTVTVSKIGVFNAEEDGDLCFESLLSSPVSLRSGDQLQVTQSVTL